MAGEIELHGNLSGTAGRTGLRNDERTGQQQDWQQGKTFFHGTPPDRSSIWAQKITELLPEVQTIISIFLIYSIGKSNGKFFYLTRRREVAKKNPNLFGKSSRSSRLRVRMVIRFSALWPIARGKRRRP
jgi:hypothetical protein